MNFYRAMQNHQPDGIAQTVSLTFMGARADKWPANQLAGMAAFFATVGYKPTSEWKEEIISFDQSKSNAPTSATFPDGTTVQLSPDKDPRVIFADDQFSEVCALGGIEPTHIGIGQGAETTQALTNWKRL